MAHKMEYWQSASGRWYVNNIKNLNQCFAKWYFPMRALGLSVEDYILLLKKYKAEGLRYCESSDYLFFYFLSENDAKSFCSYLNKMIKNYYK